MPGFRVDPETLTEYGLEMAAREPFSDLAAVARNIEPPLAPAPSSIAIDRFTARLAQELIGLATATGSLGRATRSAAAGYGEAEASISRLAGG